MSSKVKLEIIGVFPTFYSPCKGVRRLITSACSFSITDDILKDYADDVSKTYKDICDLVKQLVNYFGDHLEVEAVDPTTPLGIWRSIKYRISRYPAFIINGKHKMIGVPSFEELKELITRVCIP